MQHRQISTRSGRGLRLAALFACLAALLSLPALRVNAEETWEGNAAVIRKGEFDSPGLFAASDSFPKNTLIQVENPQNGKQVQVTVVERINGRGNVFLLLSQQAAAALGLSSSEVIRVKAKVLVSLGQKGAGLSEDQARSQDPDVNPSAALAALTEPQQSAALATGTGAEAVAAAPSIGQSAPSEAQAEAPAEAQAEAAAEAQSIQPAAPTAEAPAQPEAVTEALVPSETPATTEQAAAGPAQPEAAAQEAAPVWAAQGPTPEEKRLAELAERIPQKQLFMPPRQSERFALAQTPPAAAAPEETPAAETEEAAAEEAAPAEIAPATPEAAQVAAAEEAPLPSLGGPVAEEKPSELLAGPPGPEEPETPSAEGKRLATPEEEIGELAPALPEYALEEPAAEAPAEASLEGGPSEAMQEVALAPAAPGLPEAPEEAPAQPPVEVAALPPAGVPAVETAEAPAKPEVYLASRSYYLQLGAYSTRGLAEKLAGDIGSNYAIAILPATAHNRLFYKVLIGPLNRDESGTLLYQFRARGFKDAFIKYIE